MLQTVLRMRQKDKQPFSALTGNFLKFLNPKLKMHIWYVPITIIAVAIAVPITEHRND